MCGHTLWAGLVGMGTSGVGFFDDDTACTVRDEFIHLLTTAANPAEATRSIIDARAAAIADIDDGPVLWLALADRQWSYGCLVPDVRTRAIDVIDSGADLSRWQSPADLKRRQAVLRRLREKILSPQPRPRRPRRRKPIHIPSVRVAAPDGSAAGRVRNARRLRWRRVRRRLRVG
jgi:hypothetical protein